MFLVTKPGAAGAQLAADLTAAGHSALHLPAFDILPCADPAAARAVLGQLAQFDLVVLVSPAAVRATAGLLAGPWPAGTRIAAVGAATADVARRELPLGNGALLIAPPVSEDEAMAGSEALWHELQTLMPAPRRVLVLRAEQGREWLAEQLRAAGAEVQSLAVYRRVARPWTDALSAASIAATLQGARPVLVVTSSESVKSVLHNAEQGGVADALRAGMAVTSHARISTALTAAGFSDVRTLARIDAAGLLALLPR